MKHIKKFEQYEEFKYKIGDYVLIKDPYLGPSKAKIIDIREFNKYCYVINQIYRDSTFSGNHYLPKSSIIRKLNKKEMQEIDHLVSADKYNF